MLCRVRTATNPVARLDDPPGPGHGSPDRRQQNRLSDRMVLAAPDVVVSHPARSSG